MDLNSQIELEIYFADHFDTILFPVLADMYLKNNELNRSRKVCEIGLKHHPKDSAGLFILSLIILLISDGFKLSISYLLISKLSFQSLKFVF